MLFLVQPRSFGCLPRVASPVVSISIETRRRRVASCTLHAISPLPSALQHTSLFAAKTLGTRSDRRSFKVGDCSGCRNCQKLQMTRNLAIFGYACLPRGFSFSKPVFRNVCAASAENKFSSIYSSRLTVSLARSKWPATTFSFCSFTNPAMTVEASRKRVA